MKALQRFEKIISEIRGRVQEEVGSLIGEQLSLTLEAGTLISKGAFFDALNGKTVLALMDLSGEITGTGALLVSVKDAIRLGGTLIMLPPAELDEVVGQERYEGETEDAYGEIANIIAGCYTKAFEEMYPKACRFVRKEQQVVMPLKVDGDSDDPIPNQQYYRVAMGMELEDKPLGTMFMLIPAEPFDLVTKPAADAADGPAAETHPEPMTEPMAPDIQEAPPAQHDSAAPASAPAPPSVDRDALTKRRKKIDGLLELCRERIAEEVGALLGVPISCGEMENKPIGKEPFFFEEATGKQVMALIDVVGDADDRAFLFVGLKDAIRIGGTLIMLPPGELEMAVTEEDFGADSQDAYGEIANIIAGVYTAVFEEHYPRTLRFVKKELDQVVPMKVEIASPEPIPDQLYYLNSMLFGMGGKEYGRLQMLFPAPLLELEQLGQSEEEPAGVAASAETQHGASDDYRQGLGRQAGQAGDGEGADVLLVSDADNDARMIQQVLHEAGLSWKMVSFKDNLKRHLPGPFRAVFLVMSRVDERAFGVAIKISSSCSLPLIAAGPEWTRSAVFRAVKYGITDIVLTPAEHGDIEEKIRNNILSMAA